MVPKQPSSELSSLTATDMSRLVMAQEASRVDDLLSRVLLPASCLVPCMTPLSMELWALIKMFPAETRFRLYSELKVNAKH